MHKRNTCGSSGQQTLLHSWNEAESVGRKAARAEAILCNMLVEHNLPFLLMDHLPGVICHAFLDSKIASEVKCARTKATSVVKHAIGPAVHKDMVASVKASPAFSLMMDESTDRGDVMQVGILIRFYDESSFRSNTVFLGLYDIPQANAAISLRVSIYKYLRMTWVMKSSLVGTVMELVSCWEAVTVSLVV